MACLYTARWLLAVAAGAAMGAEPGTGTPPGREIVVLNRGVGGNSSRDGLARFQRDVEAAHPQHLILYFGINDALNSSKLVPLAEFRANLQAMVDRARSLGVRTIVLTTPNPIVASYVKARHPNHPQADLEAYLAGYDAAVRDLARADDLLLADLGREIRQSGVPVEDARSVIRNEANSRSADGVHLTAAGNRLLAGICARLLAGRAAPGETVLCFGDSITFGAHVPGAGSACGQTYPAWLWYFLNRPLGVAQGDAPPAAGTPATANR